MKFLRFKSGDNSARAGILRNESEVSEISGDMFGSFKEIVEDCQTRGKPSAFCPPAFLLCFAQFFTH